MTNQQIAEPPKTNHVGESGGVLHKLGILRRKVWPRSCVTLLENEGRRLDPKSREVIVTATYATMIFVLLRHVSASKNLVSKHPSNAFRSFLTVDVTPHCSSRFPRFQSMTLATLRCEVDKDEAKSCSMIQRLSANFPDFGCS